MSIKQQQTILSKMKDNNLKLQFFNANEAFKGFQDNAAYDHEGIAICDLIDNAIDAKATKVSILACTGGNLESNEPSLKKSSHKDKLSALLIVDNGHGMADNFIRVALTVGRSTKGNSDEMGKYGYGLKNAGIAFGNRVSVYSKYKDGRWRHCYIDVDEFTDEVLSNKLDRAISIALNVAFWIPI